MILTHIGGPTLLVQTGGWSLLTDPTFDPPGRRYTFGLGTASHKHAGPAVAVADLPPIDAVLLSHDQHADNLDDAGRAFLPRAGRVITTRAGGRRLGATGLGPWATTRLEHPDRPPIEITATPARHGPPLSRPVVGETTGFALRWPGQADGALWISGDTVPYAGVRQVADRLAVGTAVLHFGAVRFPVTGPLRYTMTAAEGARLAQHLGAHTVVPVHYDGWGHFHEGRPEIERAFAAARVTLRWLDPGRPATVPR
ncbi:MBL fold metallo-hydrolase [Actinoplanes sp. RD1]|uniref:MBL fold metallo-hydrolase n=1 Tax=Actinoplanes sp. RD1 TaxID=3064538 RepID=UPI002740900E|nr:MBL fold metallo-hydrolase [Actinoplanes sp. RD1]